MIRFSLAIIILTLLAGCENSFYALVSETTQSPTTSIPLVVGFSSLAGNPVSWSNDPNASGYVVYRRPLTSATYSVVYQGTGTMFLDTSATADTMYAYTLAKVRGQKVFPAGSSAVGAWDTSYTAFPNGVNNTQLTAAPVGADTVSGTIFYYSTSSDALTGQQVLINYPNWYYIDLGPRMQEFIDVEYGNSSQAGDLVVSTSSDTVATNNDEISIQNPATTAQRIYFNVHFNPSVASAATQTLVNYQLVFQEITNYP